MAGYRTGTKGSGRYIPEVKMNESVLERLHQTLLQRLDADVESSYVAKLCAGGLDEILKKIGEEATETVIAAKEGSADKLIHETADLWFHTMVLLAQQGLSPQQVMDELERRMGTSGIDEKAARKAHN